MTLAPLAIRRHFPLTDCSSEQHIVEVDEQNKVIVCLHLAESLSKKVPNFTAALPNLDLSKVLVLLVHGLEGSAESTYVKGVCEKSLSLGMSVCRLNLRNCGDSLHLAQGLYNAGMSADAIAVAKHLKAQFGFSQIFLCGFSLGGNIVLKAAGELGRELGRALGKDEVKNESKNESKELSSETMAKVIDGVCAVCPPIDLHQCVGAIERRGNRLYEHGFLGSLKEKIRAKNRLFPGRFDVDRLAAISSLRAFDNTYTAFDAGYESADAYYHGASALRVMPYINVPTLVVAAADDPLVPIESFRCDELAGNVNVKLVTPEKGGHVAFISDKNIALQDLVHEWDREHEPGPNQQLKDRFWGEWQVVQFILAVATGRH